MAEYGECRPVGDKDAGASSPEGRKKRMVLRFHRQALVATPRSCCGLLSNVLLEVLNPQISHLISCHVRAAGCYGDYATWFQPTNCQGMCKQRNVTKILMDHKLL